MCPHQQLGEALIRRSSVPGPVGASVGLSGRSDEHGHDDDPDRDAKNHAEREADHELQH